MPIPNSKVKPFNCNSRTEGLFPVLDLDLDLAYYLPTGSTQSSTMVLFSSSLNGCLRDSSRHMAVLRICAKLASTY